MKKPCVLIFRMFPSSLILKLFVLERKMRIGILHNDSASLESEPLKLEKVLRPHRSRQRSKGFAARLWWSLFFLNKRFRNSEEMEALDAKQFHWEIYILHSSEALHDFPISNMILIESNNFSESKKSNQQTSVKKLMFASSCWDIIAICQSQKIEVFYGAITLNEFPGVYEVEIWLNSVNSMFTIILFSKE